MSAVGVRVEGIVQGVGFRPFVFQLARKFHLKGHVANTAQGVLIHAEGRPHDLEAFCHAVKTQAPPLSHITRVTQTPAKTKGHDRFFIRQSADAQTKDTLISPDVCVCEDCLREMLDPADRRYLYPFINCTNCGPRYTIIESVPYDRPKTSMKHFAMCDLCRAEYEDPANRRFHAQPNACPVCGPHVTLTDADGQPYANADPVSKTRELLLSGKIVAIKGLGGFHLAADALNEAAVTRLRRRKNREEKALAVMSPDLDIASGYAVITQAEAGMLQDRRRPIVLCQKRLPEALAPSVSPKNPYYGVMLPYTPLHYLILGVDPGDGFTALVMTSGNLSEEPIAIQNQEALDRLSQIADAFLIHNRDIYLRSDDSVACHAAGKPRLIRRSRGYVPTPVFLHKSFPQIMACGPELKNTMCFTRGDQAFLSQHIGDMENPAALDFFRRTADHLKRVQDLRPEICAHDLHPDYMTTRFALEESGLPCIGVQHHHAHIVSCMAENRVHGPVIGLSFDGTGYGTDGNIWGCEILIADFDGFIRAASLENAAMPGGEAAVKQPWRMAVSYLFQVDGDRFYENNHRLLKRHDPRKAAALAEMIQKKVNCPLTSSLGRLFDGVASLCGIRDQVRHEGQAAMELEAVLATGETSFYETEIISGDPARVAIGPIIQGVAGDLENNLPKGIISAKFHNSLVLCFTRLCADLRKTHGIDKAVLSGGVFQNQYLLTHLSRALEKQGFEVFTHSLVPTNDGGVSLGQAVVAGTLAKKGKI